MPLQAKKPDGCILTLFLAGRHCCAAVRDLACKRRLTGRSALPIYALPLHYKNSVKMHPGLTTQL
jgi:hypothetical protein